MKALLFFAPLLRPHVRRFALALALSLITLAAGTALLGVSGWFLTATALAGAVSFNLFAPSAAVRGFSFIRILARYFEKLVGHDATLKLLSTIRQWLFGALFPRLPLPDRSLRHGDLVSRLTADVDALDEIVLLAIGPLLAALILGGVMSAILFALLPAAGWIYLSALLAAAIALPALLAAATRKTGAALVTAAADLRTHVLDAIAGHDDITLFGRKDYAAARFATAGETLSRLRRRQALATALTSGAVAALTGLALAAILYFGLAAFAQGALSGPVLAGLVFGVMGSFEATSAIVRSVGKFGTAAASAQRLHAIATLPPAIREPARPVALPPGTDIVFENVGFAYPEGEPVLEALDLTLAPGEHVAIAGPSGAGKSTLLNLLLRLADPQQGRIAIAGADIRDVSLANLHARIALLSQDSPVFFDTVRNNLLIARPEATDAELFAALATARLDNTIRALSAGLDTMVGETGATLSAGQLRRLCLARTLLSPAAIVALDEPTAGLDRETELAFLSDLPRALADRTVLLVTHAALPAGLNLRTLTLARGSLTETRP
ncbi:thiol reductant ABC exporter subunit CydC [Pelagibacterium xiamenense]|uniref:thiol reductant ABC exporter subunit CydC n=1 Tax=Pelagibacterium xiamenense TaxID=2901140 RepID=UPI001E63FDFE|nr:thiol reductant ABC exporter subunit CydC [Pelagibacterium xiamenense]MCD7060668.1 thiol reductant ABC exporter subunit CydC [Pelagibacterium xiamenense]